MGAFGLGSYVLLKSLSGTSAHVTILQIMGPVGSVLAIFFTEWMAGRDKRRFIFWLGFLGRFILVLMLVVNSPVSFLLVSALIFIFSPGITPAINAILQANISRPILGKLYSYNIAIASTAVMLSTFISGQILNAQPSNFRWLFAIAGVISFSGFYILSRIHIRGGMPNPEEKTLRLRHQRLKEVLYKSLWVPLRHSITVLRENPSFAIFERNFFLYGLAFMILMVVVPVFLVEELDISYSQVGIAGSIFQLATIIALPLFGQFYDKINPAGFCKWVFLILVFYPLGLMLTIPLARATGISPIVWVYLASAIFGAGMGGLSLVWSLASIYFAESRDSAPFMGAHVTLVGVRGAIGPVVGFTIHKFFGPYPAFLLALSLFLTAFILMAKLEGKLPRALAVEKRPTLAHSH